MGRNFMEDATTRKLMSPLSVWKSHRPNSYKKAIERIDSLIDDLDPNVALKASVYTIDQHAGKAAQSVDLTSKGDKIKSDVIVNVVSEEQRKKVVDLQQKSDEI